MGLNFKRDFLQPSTIGRRSVWNLNRQRNGKMDSHAAAMIKRFREGKPTSRAEREKKVNGVSEMWWIEKDEKAFTTTDEIDLPRNSPIKPLNRNELWSPTRSPAPVRRNESWRNPVTPPRRVPQRLDDLISDDIDDHFLSRPEIDSPYSRPKAAPYERSLDLLGSLRFSREDRVKAKPSEDKTYRFRTSLKFEDDLDIYRSLERNRQLTDSVDNLGTIGFKSLLVPNLKLDGRSDPPPSKPEGPTELVNLTSNLDALLRSFNITKHDDTDLPYTVHDVPQSITQVTNQLNADMVSFVSHYQNKYSAEETLQKEQAKRDSEMKQIGQQEAQLKMILDTERYNLYCEELQSLTALKKRGEEDRDDPSLVGLSSDEKILQDIENNIKQRRLLALSRDGTEEKEGDGMYRHHLYHRRWMTGNGPDYREMGLSDLSANINYQRTETLHRLHHLTPHWSSTDRAGTALRVEEKYHEEEKPLTGIDVLSFSEVNHRSITTAARDTISCCLNATMATLALRLPGEDEMNRQVTQESEMEKKHAIETQILKDELDRVREELERKDIELLERIKELTPPAPAVAAVVEEATPSPSPAPVELINHLNKEDLKKLEDLLGPEETDSKLLKEVLGKRDISDEELLKSSQRRNLYFQSTHDIEDKIARRGGDGSKKQIHRYVYPSKMPIPEASAPELPLDGLPSPPMRTARTDSSPLLHEREDYLQKMKNMRKKMMAS
jgi:hypothetical protein